MDKDGGTGQKTWLLVYSFCLPRSSSLSGVVVLAQREREKEKRKKSSETDKNDC